MTQEDKDLLIKDLCARLHYGVKFTLSGDSIYTIKGIDLIVTDEGDWEYAVTAKGIEPIEIKYIKPYLRPMSSMMQGEWEQMTALIYPYGRVNRNPENKNELLLWLNKEGNDMPISFMDNVFSWLNEHHFDYRGLIERDLALEAPADMYKYDE